MFTLATCPSRPTYPPLAPFSGTAGSGVRTSGTSDSDLDFSTVDSVQEAAVLPALNPATFLLQLNAIASAEQGHESVAATLDMTLGQTTPAQVVYRMSDPDTASLEGKGSIGGQKVEDSWWYNDDAGGWSIAGIVGSSTEQMLLTESNNHSMFLRGDVGSIHVHELITPRADHSGVDFRGKIGGQALQESVTFGHDAQGQATLHVEGTLGGQAIRFDEALSAKASSSQAFSGQGNIAGLDVSLSDTITLTPTTH
jgi:hypothetical protein